MIILLVWALVAVPCALALWCALRVHARRGGER